MDVRRSRAASSAIALVIASVLLAGCAGASDSTAASTPPASATPARPPTTEAPPSPTTAPPSTPSPSVSLSPPWTVGASPLPLRPDGFGYVLPTPPELVDRRLPTVDLLPPPANGEFASTIAPISPAIRKRMGETWSPDCPVSLSQLRYLTVSFWGFDAKPHTGELVINRTYAQDIVAVFRKLYAAKFPIEEMRLITTADVKAKPTGDTNNTSAFICRAAVGQTRWSEHAYGRAIDVNPFQNPYVKDDLVLPELASAYVERSYRRPGMIFQDDVVVRAFADIGWGWGGDWQHSKDYQHFSSTGN